MKIFRNAMSIPYSFLIIVSASLMSWRPFASERYVIDQEESILVWKCSMSFVPQNGHTGYVKISKGDLTFENGRLARGVVEIDMNTIADEMHGSDNNLIDHIKSPDFFDVEKFPTSTFIITRIASGKGSGINVIGNLTIKGITHEVTIPATIDVNAGIVNANGKVIIDRTKWDVRYGSGKFFSNLADETISDEIEVSMKIVARKK